MRRPLKQGLEDGKRTSDETKLREPTKNPYIKERSHRYSTTLNNPDMTYMNPDIKKGKKFLADLFKQKQHMRAQRHARNWDFKPTDNQRNSKRLTAIQLVTKRSEQRVKTASIQESSNENEKLEESEIDRDKERE